MKFFLVIACLALIVNATTSYGQFYQLPLLLSPNYPTSSPPQKIPPEYTVGPSILGNILRFKSHIREKWANAADNVVHTLRNTIGFKKPHFTLSQTNVKPQPGHFVQVNSGTTSHYPQQYSPAMPTVLLYTGNAGLSLQNGSGGNGFYTSLVNGGKPLPITIAGLSQGNVTGADSRPNKVAYPGSEPLDCSNRVKILREMAVLIKDWQMNRAKIVELAKSKNKEDNDRLFEEETRLNAAGSNIMRLSRILEDYSSCP